MCSTEDRRIVVSRFFFHTADGSRDRDHEGMDCRDARSARVEAIRYAGALLSDQPDILWDGRDFRVEVTDKDQRLVCTVIALAVDAPRPEE